MTPARTASSAAWRAVRWANWRAISALIFQVGGFDHQRIRLAADLFQVIDATYIADMHQAGAGALRTQHLIGLDRATVGQGDRQPFHQIAAPGARRNFQGLGLLRQERPPG